MNTETTMTTEEHPPFPLPDDVARLRTELWRMIGTNALMLANLTRTQERCNELLEETRWQRAELAAVSQALAILTSAGARSNAVRVNQFMAATGQKCRTSPEVPPDEEVRLRMMLVAEECFELLAEALDVDLMPLRDQVLATITMAPVFVDLAKFAKELSDVRYVVDGTSLAFGIIHDHVDLEVHRSNMSKVGAPRDANGKIQKGEGYVPADVEGALLEMGWKP